jgi:hypothetical protein
LKTHRKNVTSLKVVGEGKTDGILFNGSQTTNGTSITSPLKTVGIQRGLVLLNSGNPNLALVDEDIIRFNYTTQELLFQEHANF